MDERGVREPVVLEQPLHLFEVYLGGETGSILSKDVDIGALVKKTAGYVGADIEALVREAKMAAMRDFVVVIGTKSEPERRDAVKNVMITRAHFDAALAKVRGSLDRDAMEKSETQAWRMLYNQDQRTILEKALDVSSRAAAMPKKIDESLVADLRKAVFRRKKDFAELKKLTEVLERKMEKR